MNTRIDPSLAIEAKAITALAFRNGPIEDLHAGKVCSACAGNAEFSHISDDEMKRIMKAAVNSVYRLLSQRDHDPDRGRPMPHPRRLRRRTVRRLPRRRRPGEPLID